MISLSASYSPGQASYVQKDGDCIDLLTPDFSRSWHFKEAQPEYEDVLEPGEVLYIPGGWFHDVTSLADSISVTWNFVHSARLSTLCDYLRQNPSDSQIEVIRFFLRQELPGNASVETIISFLEKRWGRLSPPVPCSAPAKAFDRSISTISFKGEKENVATIA